jgi:hypothetical protein
MLGHTLLQLLLQVAAAMLVLAQARNITLQFFQTRTREAVDLKR